MNVPLFEFLPPSEADRPYTVSEINEGLSIILEATNTTVWLEGEISNWKVSSNGHAYFRLKDAQSQVPSVMWRQTMARLDFEPEDGLAVLAIATIKIYKKAGYYQLDVHRIEPRGKGALFLAFERLKAKLESEGLFDPAHKLALPASVRRLGVITSKQGAALRDIVRVVTSRAPETEIVLVDVPVQGDTAAGKIAAAIRAINLYSKSAPLNSAIDCLIVGRGGGSAEDLWAFNEEIVARAIFESDIPVISAVGHEIDFTIADFAADVRAPTPSAAAEMAVQDRAESRRFFDACESRFSVAASRALLAAKNRLAVAAGGRILRRPLDLILENRQTLDLLTTDFVRHMTGSLQTARQRFAGAAARLNTISPLAVLGRGYSVITNESGTTIRSADKLAVDQNIRIRLHHGSATASVTGVIKT